MLWRVRHLATTGALMLMLGSCGMIDGQRDGGLHVRPAQHGMSEVSDVPVKVGAPYQVNGVTYAPADAKGYEATGYASWYGEELNGNRTANGEQFRPSGISAAHRTLPLPSYVEVTALTTGRTILVRINDRGPFTQSREIDLSRGAAEQLGILGGGATPVRVQRVEPSEADRALLRSGRRAAERRAVSGSMLADIRTRIGYSPPAQPRAPLITSLPAKGLYMVQVASFADKDRAEALAARIGARAVRIDSIWRVDFGPYTTASDARAGVNYAASKGFRDAIIMANDDESKAPSH